MWVPGLTCSHSNLEALALLPQPLRVWDDHIVQRNCTRGLRIPAHLTLWLANLEARGVLQQPAFLVAGHARVSTAPLGLQGLPTPEAGLH